MNEHVAKRIQERVSRMTGLEDTTAEEVLAVYEGKEINDPFKTVAITRELEEYGVLPKQ